MRRFPAPSYSLAISLLVALLVRPSSSSAQEPIFQPINPDQLFPVEINGFGDPANTWFASMKWFKGSLYVGTVRSAHCVFAAVISTRFPVNLYPPPQIDCETDPRDLPLAAEIWRFTPSDSSWDLVFSSPEDVPIAFSPQGVPTKFTARDIGFSSMEVHVEGDGTEALYVGGRSPVVVFAPFFHALGAAPPPRLLRSVDGVSFTPVPQDPGTFLGSLGQPLPGTAATPTSFTALVSLNGSLAALLRTTAGGALLSSSQPASGNNAWALASPSPEELPLSEIARFNGALYLGVDSQGPTSGYQIVKTSLDGAAPFSFVPVLARDEVFAPSRITSLAEHRGRLYAGSSWPSELIRIEPDDTWELVAGEPAAGVDGEVLPLSGIPAGFGNSLNALFTTMQSHDGSLYAGTMDMSLLAFFFPQLAPIFQNELGFDMLRSEEGVYWHPVTRNGLGSFLQYGVQSLESTPSGLFVGTAAGLNGAQVFLKNPLPPAPTGPAAPYRLEAASELITDNADDVVLSWEPVPDAVAYHVYRSTVTPFPEALVTAASGSGSLPASPGLLYLDGLPMLCDAVPTLCAFFEVLSNESGRPGPFEWIDATTDPFYVDLQPTSLQSIYFVRAQRADGTLSGPSNVVGGTSTAAPVTFPAVEDELVTLFEEDRLGGGALRALTFVRRAGYTLSGGNFPAATHMLELAESLVDAQRGTELTEEEADDLCLWIYRLRRNVQLVEWSLISDASLY
jgi:hypothetical protein